MKRVTRSRAIETLDISFAMRIASEHLSYRSLMEEIEGDLERVRRAETTSTEDLLRLLESFYFQVRTHFALEEKGGLFELYRERAFALREQSTALLAQHRDLLERLRRSLETVRTLDTLDSPEFEQCARELGELFRALREHELAEDTLLSSLVEQDIGRGTRPVHDSR